MEFSLVSDDQPVQKSSPATKRKRSLPGMPDPDSEVIALSPKTLLATNRFVCEICDKGFQRDQNLQLHRRGHNLPWKLRQRSDKDLRKRVYVCPEPSCTHHDPSRALGDLTGIKKHYCRKHGEKKHKCERCSKQYAVQSDWKAHMKICGTKEHRCACGSLFSRKDSFTSHRAFCDVLAQDSSAHSHPQTEAPATTSSPPPSPLTPPTCCVLSPVLSVQSSAELPEYQIQPPPPPPPINGSLMCSMDGPDHRGEINPFSLSLSSSQNNPQTHFIPSPRHPLSATALLQKASQMGAMSSNASSFLHGLWLPCHQGNVSTMASETTSRGLMLEKNSIAYGLELGLPSNGLSDEFMMGSSDLFSDKQPATTLDFLGLGLGGVVTAASGGFSAFMSSVGGGLCSTDTSIAGVRPAVDGSDDAEADRKLPTL